MKKLLLIPLAALLLFSSLAPCALAAAPPQKDGVVFSGFPHAGKKVALTFDDGPHPCKTARILDILDRFNVKATFFVVGENAEYYPDTVAAEAAHGHEIANHSYSHPNLAKKSREEIEAQITRADKAIRKACGKTPRLFRPPEGAYSQTIVEVAEKLGKKTVIWTVDTKDWARVPAREIADNVKANVTCGSIILFHDYTRDAHTEEALELIIPLLKSQGYEFVTVSELIAENAQNGQD